jgi:hypothetical protein
MDYVQFTELEHKRIAMGCDDEIVLDKMFGPTVFATIRITPSLERGGWVIERAMDRGWTEIMVLPAQVDADFEAKDE